MSEDYIPPKVWSFDSENGGSFAAINRPTAGARTKKSLPVGEHPLQLYSMGTPNGVKVTILLEELLELGIQEAEYDAWLIDIREGEQFTSGFVDINPNSKIPALVDKNNGNPINLFESGAILLYLAEKFARFIPQKTDQRANVLSWLFWQVGSAPFLGGGFGHFYAYAPKHYKYPIDRFAMETKRQLDVLDKLLADQHYIAGNEYTIADIAIFPWYGAMAKGLLYQAGEFLAVHEYQHINAWADRLLQRKAVLRGRIVNKTLGEENSRLKERHSASDFNGKELIY